jgi:hypothetical protein
MVGKIQSNKMRLVAGAVAAAAVAVPMYASLAVAEAPQATAGPACLAWFGNKEDGNCLSYSNGTGATIGTPQFGFGENGFGFYTGPLLPGTTISRGIGGS